MPGLKLGDDYTQDGVSNTEVKPDQESEGEGAQEDASTSEETQVDTQDDGDEVIRPAEEGDADDSSGKGAEDVGSDDEDTELSALEAIRKQKQDLLDEISQLRKDRRDLRDEGDKSLFVPKKTVANTEELEGIAAEDITIIEKVVQKLGYVKKDEIQQTSYQDRLEAEKDAWLKAHPEYLPENDPDDKRWKSLQGTMKELFESYPSDPKKIGKMLSIAHKELNPKATLPVKNRAITDAAKAKIATSSKTSGGGSGASAKAKSSLGFDARQYLHGFSDEEASELLS